MPAVETLPVDNHQNSEIVSLSRTINGLKTVIQNLLIEREKAEVN